MGNGWVPSLPDSQSQGKAFGKGISLQKPELPELLVQGQSPAVAAEENGHLGHHAEPTEGSRHFAIAFRAARALLLDAVPGIASALLYDLGISLNCSLDWDRIHAPLQGGGWELLCD